MFRNFNFYIKWKWMFFAVLGIFLVNVQVFAQAPIQPIKPDIVKEGVTQVQLRNATTRLDKIEALFSKVESKQVFTQEQSEEVSKATIEYAQAVKAALDNALKNAETLAKTQGSQGSIEPLNTFEKAEKANEPRLRKIEQRANAIEKQIRTGRVKIDRPALEKLSVPERTELFNSLEPPTRQIYIKTQPDLFKPVINTPQKDLKLLKESSENYQSFVPEHNIMVNYHVGNTVSDMLQKVSNFVVPPAYAAVAAPCVGLAISKNWTALATCVVSSSSQATKIYNEFVSCWNKASGFWKWFKRTACLAKLIIKLG
ncbi:hypothetical protein [Calothrix sp. PCC 7507]|uniref:hypothetical protein n=1 Tax=Calothrix sp. PCC 7507 TaxID=99598 RepID=UPI00029EF029|nr:hypothetical protein [Calothrix sp. PCC 7507]AFY36072.1 hypothetical protein Cal7507_5751 [Calothrix sp. PCC 7507]